MNSLIVIPARYGSTRFPGKPLALIAGVSLLQRTWQIAKAVTGVTEVCIATDDERIRDHAVGFGATCVMTPSTCENGSERVCAALQEMHRSVDTVINLQGDAVLTPPWVIEALVQAMNADPALQMATPAVRVSTEQFKAIGDSKKGGAAAGTLVTFAHNGDALYFSKSMIPFIRNSSGELPVYRHIGLYAYRPAVLKKLIEFKPGQFEIAEGLEQLRALENGIPVRVVLVDYRSRTHWSVDSPDDAKVVEQIIAREGELIHTGSDRP